MNTEAYISSGKLEQYLLGLLSESEAREVEQVASAYPEIRAELNAMEEALTNYAVAKGIHMPADLPERIVRRWETLDREIPPEAQSRQVKKTAGGNGLLLLLGLLLLAAVAGLVFLFFSSKELQEELQQSQAELQTLQAECDQIRNNLNELQGQLPILLDDGNQTRIMYGTNNNPGAIASVYYNPKAQRVYLDIQNLSPPPTGQQYQLWGINTAGDGTPQSMDVFNIPADGGVIEVPYLPDVNVFAVSLEPLGGSESPTAVHLISG